MEGVYFPRVCCYYYYYCYYYYNIVVIIIGIVVVVVVGMLRMIAVRVRNSVGPQVCVVRCTSISLHVRVHSV
jgi:hypothetical protein